MRVGLDSFSLHPLGLSPMQELEYLTAHGFDGIQFGGVDHLVPQGDRGPAREVLAYAQAHGLYTHVSVGSCNPHFGDRTPGQLTADLTARVRLAAELGWHELHGVLGGPHERYELPVSWPRQLADATAVLKAVAPVLRDCASRINLETHGDVTTFELLRMIGEVGDDVLGVCLDTANVVLFGEHPVAAARRVAPVTHLLHCKDVVLTLLRRRRAAPDAAARARADRLAGTSRRAPALFARHSPHHRGP